MEDDEVLPLAAELNAVEQVARSVQARHPQVAPERIRQRAREEHQRYATARIRDFVPLLVERTLLLELHAGEQAE